MTGTVFNLQRYCVNDGPGIRTTVFLKGCPLRCIWCHNPESKSAASQIFYDPAKCLGCGACVAACPNGCHAISESGHRFDRANCAGCGACARVCPGALDRAGTPMTADEVLRVVESERVFYGSDGGMTLSGGEPFHQFEFMMALLRGARERGIGSCVETCGYTSGQRLLEAAPLVECFLFDIKETDPERHRAFTGVDNARILQNLRLLDGIGARIVLRCPIIPGCNDRSAHFEAIGALTRAYSGIARVELEPYHPLGSAKAANLGVAYPLGALGFPQAPTVNDWLAALERSCACEVRRA